MKNTNYGKHIVSPRIWRFVYSTLISGIYNSLAPKGRTNRLIMSMVRLDWDEQISRSVWSGNIILFVNFYTNYL